jgi:hypothetical protein
MALMSKKYEGERYCEVCGKKLTEYQKNCCSLSCSAVKSNRMCRGESGKNYHGGIKRHVEGYTMVLRWEHPSHDQNGYVYEHRLIMEEEIGRYLESREIVHHLNGQKDDNRLSNLMLFSNQREHQLFHMGVFVAGDNWSIDLKDLDSMEEYF